MATVSINNYASSVASIVDICISLTVDIINLLRAERSIQSRRLEGKLNSLCTSIILTRLAVEAYEYTPIGQNLANTISPEMERCLATLREIFDKINSCWEGLRPTRIGSLWPKVWWGGFNAEELASLTRQISIYQESFNKFLAALNSCVFFTHLSNHQELMKPYLLSSKVSRGWILETNCAQIAYASQSSQLRYDDINLRCTTSSWIKC
jgi:hypothetical protein